MIIVSDTTPFRYLIEIEAVEILEKLLDKLSSSKKSSQSFKARAPQNR
jgi:predicted nucleic acid-binding protein